MNSEAGEFEASTLRFSLMHLPNTEVLEQIEALLL